MADILVADDDPIIQRLLTFILELDGHTVHLANDGAEAIALLEENRLDLLVLDLDMPEYTGLDVLRMARANALYRELPIVILTASGQERDSEEAVKAGVTEFITKPFGSRALRAALNRLIA